MNRYLLLFLFLIVVSEFSIAEEKKDNSFIHEEKNNIYSSREHYTILKTLGEGLFGKVYLVEDSQGSQYALKSYKRHENPVYAGSLFAVGEREFSRGQLLSHPHIIKTFDYFCFNSSDCYFDNLILQYIEGTPISKVNKGDLTKQQAATTVIDLYDALRYALDLGLIYSDLSESNVMINEKKEIFIIDLASFFTLEECLSVSNALKEQFPWIDNKNCFNGDNADEGIKTEIYFNYFEKICAVSINMLFKSNIQRDEKINLQVQIRKIAFNYKEDIEEKLEIPFSNYLNNLKDLINDWGKN